MFALQPNERGMDLNGILTVLLRKMQPSVESFTAASANQEKNINGELLPGEFVAFATRDGLLQEMLQASDRPSEASSLRSCLSRITNLGDLTRSSTY